MLILIHLVVEHELRPEEPTDENIPLDPVTLGLSRGGSTWEQEQETSFGGHSAPLHGGTSLLHKEYLVGEIYELIGNKNITDWNLICTCSNLVKMKDYIIKGNL